MKSAARAPGEFFDDGRDEGRRWALRKDAGPEVERVATLSLSVSRAGAVGRLDASAQIAVRALDLTGDEAALVRAAHVFWVEATGGGDMDRTFDRYWLRGFLSGVREGYELRAEP